MQRFECTVTEWNYSNPENRDVSYIIYTIQIKEYYSPTDFIKWHVTKRFSEFDRLRRQLKELIPKHRIPKLPPKGLQTKTAVEKEIDERARGLEVFLQSLTSVK